MQRSILKYHVRRAGSHSDGKGSRNMKQAARLEEKQKKTALKQDVVMSRHWMVSTDTIVV